MLLTLSCIFLLIILLAVNWATIYIINIPHFATVAGWLFYIFGALLFWCITLILKQLLWRPNTKQIIKAVTIVLWSPISITTGIFLIFKGGSFQTRDPYVSDAIYKNGSRFYVIYLGNSSGLGAKGYGLYQEKRLTYYIFRRQLLCSTADSNQKINYQFVNEDLIECQIGEKRKKVPIIF